MRKLLGTIFILLLLYVGFFGIEIRTKNDSYKIKPFILNLIQLKTVQDGYGKTKDFLEENVVDHNKL